MNKAIFLDKDGTIVDDAGSPYQIPSDKLLLNDVEDGLRYLHQQGYLLFLISNQGWIAQKRLTIQQVEGYFQNIVSQLRAKSIPITAYYFCPHVTKDNCECRKPKPFFVLQAAKKYNIDLSNSYFIGDTDKDIETGKNAGTKTILVKTGQGKSCIDKVDANFIIENVNAVKKII